MKRFFVLALVACGSRTGLDASDAGDASLPLGDGAQPNVDSSFDTNVPFSCARMVLAESIAIVNSSFFRATMDAQYIYFVRATANIGQIARVSKAGGAVEILSEEGGHTPEFLANLVVDQDWLYWSSPTTSELRRMPKSGGPQTTFPCQVTVSGPHGNSVMPCFGAGIGSLPVAITGTTAWIGSHGRILRLPLAGGLATVFEEFDASGTILSKNDVWQLHASTERIFYLTRGFNSLFYDTPVNGSPGFHQPNVSLFVVDPTRVYWSYGDRIASMAVDGTGVVPQVVPPVISEIFDVDALSIYSFAAEGLRKTSKLDGTSTILEPLKGFKGITFLRADDCLYVGDGNRLVRREK